MLFWLWCLLHRSPWAKRGCKLSLTPQTACGEGDAGTDFSQRMLQLLRVMVQELKRIGSDALNTVRRP